MVMRNQASMLVIQSRLKLRETQRDSERLRETLRDLERLGETRRDLEGFVETTLLKEFSKTLYWEHTIYSN